MISTLTILLLWVIMTWLIMTINMTNISIMMTVNSYLMGCHYENPSWLPLGCMDSEFGEKLITCLFSYLYTFHVSCVRTHNFPLGYFWEPVLCNKWFLHCCLYSCTLLYDSLKGALMKNSLPKRNFVKREYFCQAQLKLQLQLELRLALFPNAPACHPQDFQ